MPSMRIPNIFDTKFKRLFFLALITSVQSVFAEVPSEYYFNVTGDVYKLQLPDENDSNCSFPEFLSVYKDALQSQLEENPCAEFVSKLESNFTWFTGIFPYNKTAVIAFNERKSCQITDDIVYYASIYRINSDLNNTNTAQFEMCIRDNVSAAIHVVIGQYSQWLLMFIFPFVVGCPSWYAIMILSICFFQSNFFKKFFGLLFDDNFSLKCYQSPVKISDNAQIREISDDVFIDDESDFSHKKEDKNTTELLIRSLFSSSYAIPLDSRMVMYFAQCYVGMPALIGWYIGLFTEYTWSGAFLAAAKASGITSAAFFTICILIPILRLTYRLMFRFPCEYRNHQKATHSGDSYQLDNRSTLFSDLGNNDSNSDDMSDGAVDSDQFSNDRPLLARRH